MATEKERAEWQRITNALRARIENDPQRPQHISEILPRVIDKLYKKRENIMKERMHEMPLLQRAAVR